MLPHRERDRDREAPHRRGAGRRRHPHRDRARRPVAVDQPRDQAAPEDQVIEQDGATVYVDESATALLDDKVLDGGVDADGNIEFALGQQA